MTARRSRPPVLAAGLVIALGLALISLPVVAADPSTSPSASPAASAPPSTQPSGSPSASGLPLPTLPPRPPLPDGLLALPETGGPLEPGTYGSWALGPLVRFTVDDQWAARGPDLSGLGWEVARLVGRGVAALSMTPFTGEVFADPCLATSDETIQIDPTPEGLVGELAANPSLFAGEPTEIEVAGYPGLQVDVATQQPMACESMVTVLWSIPDRGLFMLQDGQEARFMPIDVDGQVLVLVAETFPGADFDAFLDAATEVIETIEIDTGAVPPSIEPSASGSTEPSVGPSEAPTAEPTEEA
jgi:hypothetical protein